MSSDDRELEALLRRALQEHAEKVVPVGDGLSKIQQRAAHRRRRLVWLRPSIAVAAAALAVVAAIAIPTAIHRMDNGNSGTQAGTQPTATINDTTSASATPTETAQPKTQMAKQLTAVAMSWPYSSQKVAARSGDTSLRNPAQLATTFVASFTGANTEKTLVAKESTADGQAVTMKVRRDNVLVSTVYLAEIPSTTKPSYVVTGANGTNVQLAKSQLTTSDSITVSGTFVPDNEAATIWAGAGATYDKAKSTPVTAATDNIDSSWQLTLNRPTGAVTPGPKILAAWTVNSDGQLLDFTAMAAN
jgi:hypothetical protein